MYRAKGGAVGVVAPDYSPHLYLGETPSRSEHFDGLLDQVAVFNDVLTTQDIARIRSGQCRLF